MSVFTIVPISERVKLLDLTEPDSMPTAFGMELTHDKNAGGAGINNTEKRR